MQMLGGRPGGSSPAQSSGSHAMSEGPPSGGGEFDDDIPF
jgi:hypothetical protein